MLQITIPSAELYDEQTNKFVKVKEQTLCLEHSLVSLSKWESRWHKPFVNDNRKTTEETRDYIRCMTLTQNVNPYTYYALTDNIIRQVQDYIDDSMTATWFSQQSETKTKKQQITNELVYYWMFKLGIPKECEKWHFNRLITLIKVYDAQEQKTKPMTPSERAALNAARKKQYNTRG